MELTHFILILFVNVVTSRSVCNAFIPTPGSNAEGNGPLSDRRLSTSSEENLRMRDKPSLAKFSPALCDSCLQISKTSKELLSDSRLMNEVGNLGNIFCRLMRSESERKHCEMIAEIYEQKGTMFLQELFHDENFCVNKGFCPEKSLIGSIKADDQTQVLHIGEHFDEVLNKLQHGLPTDVVTTVFNNTAVLPIQNPTIELKSNGSCAACRNILDKIRTQLEDPDKQLKLIAQIINACETEVFVSQCKKMVFAYGPIIITNLQKVVSMDLCHMVHLCEYPRNQTSYNLTHKPIRHGNEWQGITQ